MNTTTMTATDPKIVADFLARATEQVKDLVSRGWNYDGAIYNLTDRNLLDPLGELNAYDTAYIIAELTRTLDTPLQYATNDHNAALEEYSAARVALETAQVKLAHAERMLAKAHAVIDADGAVKFASLTGAK